MIDVCSPQGVRDIIETDDDDDDDSPPNGQPELYCQWTPNKEGITIEWDTGEKFYGYIEWIEYLINQFLKKWG
jgi:hypothetical protein